LKFQGLELFLTRFSKLWNFLPLPHSVAELGHENGMSMLIHQEDRGPQDFQKIDDRGLLHYRLALIDSKTIAPAM
jgi:hypothetical protein